jgi:hypothetical protein
MRRTGHTSGPVNVLTGHDTNRHLPGDLRRRINAVEHPIWLPHPCGHSRSRLYRPTTVARRRRSGLLRVAEQSGEGREDDRRGKEMGADENELGRRVVGRDDRRDERQSSCSGGDGHEPSPTAQESSSHDAERGPNDRPPCKRGDWNRSIIHLQTDSRRPCDPRYRRRANGRDRSRDGTAPGEFACHRLPEPPLVCNLGGGHVTPPLETRPATGTSRGMGVLNAAPGRRVVWRGCRALRPSPRPSGRRTRAPTLHRCHTRSTRRAARMSHRTGTRRGTRWRSD